MASRFSTQINMVKMVLEDAPLSLREADAGDLSADAMATTPTEGRLYQLDLSSEGEEGELSAGLVDVERPFTVLVYEFIEASEITTEQELDLHDFAEDVIRKLWNADGIDVIGGSHAAIVGTEEGDALAAKIDLIIRYEFDRTVS